MVRLNVGIIGEFRGTRCTSVTIEIFDSLTFKNLFINAEIARIFPAWLVDDYVGCISYNLRNSAVLSHHSNYS